MTAMMLLALVGLLALVSGIGNMVTAERHRHD